MDVIFNLQNFWSWIFSYGALEIIIIIIIISSSSSSGGGGGGGGIILCNNSSLCDNERDAGYESRNLSCFTWLVNIKMTVKHIQYVTFPQLLKSLSSILAIFLESLNFFIL